MKTQLEQCMAHVEEAGSTTAAAALHVLISPSVDGGFVAQGIEIDFVASGRTEEETREHFARTFCLTISEYLKRGRDLRGLFKTPAPAEYRKEYFALAKDDMLVCAVQVKKDFPAHMPIPETIGFISAPAPLAA